MTKLLIGVTMTVVLALLGCSAELEEPKASAGVELDPGDVPVAGASGGDLGGDSARGREDDVQTLAEEMSRLGARLDLEPESPELLALADELNARADALAGMVASIEIGRGHAVKIYEPAPGMRMVGELRDWSMDSALSELDVAAMGAAEIHRALRPGDPVPAALIEMDQRRHGSALDTLIASSASTPASAQEASHDDDVLVEKHATAGFQHFRDHGGCPAGNRLSVCKLGQVGRTGLAAFSSERCHASTHSVAPFLGTVTLALLYYADGLPLPSHRFPFVVTQGNFFQMSMISADGPGHDSECNGCPFWQACPLQPVCMRKHGSEILNATTLEAFHYGAAYGRMHPW